MRPSPAKAAMRPYDAARRPRVLMAAVREKEAHKVAALVSSHSQVIALCWRHAKRTLSQLPATGDVP